MAWEYFTDWLEEGELITKDQRDELIDAFIERILATGHSVDEADIAEVKESHQPSDRVTATIGATTRKGFAMGEVLLHLGESYFQEDTEPTPLAYSPNTANVLRKAAIDLGLTENEYDLIDPSLRNATSTNTAGTAIITNSRIPNHIHWNILRRAIQLFKWGRVTPSNKTASGDSGPRDSWEDAKSEFISSQTSFESWFGGLTAFVSGGLSTTPKFTARGRMTKHEFSLPSFVTYYDIGLKLTGVPSANVIRPVMARLGTLTLYFDSLIAESKFVKLSGFSSDGVLEIGMRGYSELDYLDDFKPIEEDSFKLAGVQDTSVAIHYSPHFTHPFEEIDPD